jgi:hypothetical protein
MSRPTLLKLALVIALTMAAGSAYAASSFSVVTPVGITSFAPSNNVTLGVASEAGGYSAHAKHFSGDRVVGFTNTDSKLYYSSGATVGAAVAAPAASNTYSALSTDTAWKSM